MGQLGLSVAMKLNVTLKIRQSKPRIAEDEQSAFGAFESNRNSLQPMPQSCAQRGEVYANTDVIIKEAPKKSLFQGDFL